MGGEFLGQNECELHKHEKDESIQKTENGFSSLIFGHLSVDAAGQMLDGVQLDFSFCKYRYKSSPVEADSFLLGNDFMFFILTLSKPGKG